MFVPGPGPSYDTGLTNDTFCDDYCVTDLCDKFTQYLFARNNWLQWQRKTGLRCDYNIYQFLIKDVFLLDCCCCCHVRCDYCWWADQWPVTCHAPWVTLVTRHQWSRVLVTSPRGQMASILFRQEPHGVYSLQLVRATIECFLLGLNNLSSDSVSALLYSITRGKNVWSCHGGNDGPQRETIPCRTYNISHS